MALTELTLYEDDAFADVPLEESLLLDLHRRICGDLVPDWAGRWRNVAVTVGRLTPPPPFQVPMLMRDYSLDLQARWHEGVSGPEEMEVPPTGGGVRMEEPGGEETDPRFGSWSQRPPR